jgi:hypothetical protein
MPVKVAKKSVAAPAVSAQKTAYRLQLHDLRSHGLHDPPSAGQCAETDCGVRGEYDPQRECQVACRPGNICANPPAT